MPIESTTTQKRPGKKNDQIISYYELRMLIGAAGILLPFLLFIGKLIFNGSPEIEYSVSDYYDNGIAGDILVGVLFTLGFSCCLTGDMSLLTARRLILDVFLRWVWLSFLPQAITNGFINCILFLPYYFFLYLFFSPFTFSVKAIHENHAANKKKPATGPTWFAVLS